MNQESNHRRLLEIVDQDTQDYVELRLQSHTESSMKILAPIFEQLKELTRAIKAHDGILSNENVDTLLSIIAKHKENEDFKKVSIRYADKVWNGGKFIVGLATLIGALIIIKDQLLAHVK